MIPATPRIKAAQRTVLRYSARLRRRPQLYRSRHALGRQSADPARTWPVDRRHGPAALGLPVGLRFASCRAGRCRPAGAAPLLSAGLVLWSAGAGAGGFVAGFWQFVRRPRVPGPGRGADVLGRRGSCGTGSTCAAAACRPGSELLLFARHRYLCALLTFMMLSLGWRWMFVIMGLVGLVMALGFYRHAPRPRRNYADGRKGASYRRRRLARPAP